MRFLKTEINARAGNVVEVTLVGNAANVRLLDAPNFVSYERGQAHRYYGGYFTQSPVRIPVPSSGHWYVVVDLGGGAGSVRATVRVLGG